MMRSRVTLARIEAAAIDRQRASPFTSSSLVPAPTKSQLPPSSTRSAGRPRSARARWAARRCASDMPSSSHSSGLAWPTPHATHQSATRSNIASRSCSRSIFESRILLTRRSRGTTAAPRVRGPAQAPRPTSSMPTTTSWPSAQRRRSTSRDGGWPLIARRSVGTLWRWLIGAAIDIVAMVEGRTDAGGVTGRYPHASLRQQLDRQVEPLGELDLLARGVLEAHHHGAVELLGGQRPGTVERPADGAAPGHLTLHHLGGDALHLDRSGHDRERLVDGA